MKPILLSFVLLALAAPARADGVDELRQQVRDQVRHTVTQKVVTQLALDDATAKRLTELIDRFGARLDRARGSLKRDYGELRRLVDGNAEPTALDAVSGRVVDDQAEINRILDERARATHKILSPRQFAELVLAWPRINRMLADEIENARSPK
jgi:hypothetical protein